MTIKERKKQIRQAYFSTGGMIVISILGIVGLFLFLFSGILNIYDYESFYNCFSKNGMTIIFGGFFIVISIYCWIAFFKNIILNPKKEILYLIKNEDDISIFVNKKGKKFIIENTQKKESAFYYVIKTSEYIYEILDEECNLDEIWEEKKKYWMNFYSPMGNFEDIFLLPIVYVILMPGIFSFLMSKGWDKIYGLIWSAGPLYVIGYDFVYKLKIKNDNLSGEDENKFANSYILLKGIFSLFFTAIIVYTITSIFLKLQDSVSKIIFLPFYLCVILSCCTVIAKIFNKDFLYKLFLKGYVIIFLLFWFGFTTFAIIGLIKQENNYAYLLIGIPFYLFGIIAFKKYILGK